MAFNIVIEGGFFVTDDTATIEYIRNPRAETTFTFDETNEIFRFYCKSCNDYTTQNLSLLGEDNNSFDFVDLSTITEDGVNIPKTTARDLATYLSGKIGFFFNPETVEVEVQGDVSLNQNLDAFGRLRVSELTTQYDAKQIHDNLPLLIDQETIGTGSILHDTTLSQSGFSVSSSGDAAIAQSKQRFNYQSGKSQLLYWTFNDFGDGSNMAVVTSRSGTETSRTARSNWDDPLDGTGPSGITHNFDNNTILMADFEWLGVGNVRWYIIKNGQLINFHSEDFTGTTDVYMRSPNQPMRWELRQTGASSYRSRIGYFSSNTTTPFDSDIDGLFIESTDADASMNTICSSVNSEGSINKIGKLTGVDDDGVHLDANSTSQWYFAIGIRLKSDRADTLIDIINGYLLSDTNDKFLYRILFNPTYNGSVTYNNIDDSSLQFALGATANTITDDGYIMNVGAGENNSVSNFSFDNAVRLGMNIDGTVDEIVLVVKPLTSNLDIHRGLTNRELT